MSAAQNRSLQKIGGASDQNKTMRSSKSKASGSQKTKASRGNSGWTQNDVIKGKLISLLGGARLEVFSHFYSARRKVAIKRNVIDFVRKFVNYRNYKDVIMAVKNDLPKLLGYQSASIMILDEDYQSLFAMTLKESYSSELQSEVDPSFEHEFVFDKSQIVSFPLAMGLQGFAHKYDSINYINQLKIPEISLSQKEVYSRVYSIGSNVVKIELQPILNEQMGRYLSYNSKIDNFLEVEKFRSFVVSSLVDEEILAKPKVVGTLQLYNKIGSDITQDDLARVLHIRKLVGSLLIKCERITNTLQMVVGFAERTENMDESRNLVDEIVKSQQEDAVRTLSLAIGGLRKIADSTVGDNQLKNTFESKLKQGLLSRRLLDATSKQQAQN